MVRCAGQGHRGAGGDGGLHARERRRLHAEDLDARVRLLDGDRDARRHSAAADGDDDRLEVRVLLEELEADRPLAGDDEVVVEGVDEHLVLGGLDLLRAVERFVEVRAVEDDAGAVAPGAGDLHQRRGLRHHDGGVNAEPLRVIGDRLRVVPGARANDAAAALFAGERHELIAGAALLEGARHLQVLELEPELAARRARERLAVGAGRDEDAVGDALAGGFDVLKGEHRPRV